MTISKGLSLRPQSSAAASYAKNLYTDGHFGTFEAGFKIRNGHKTQDSTETVYDGWSTSGYPAMLDEPRCRAASRITKLLQRQTTSAESLVLCRISIRS